MHFLVQSFKKRKQKDQPCRTNFIPQKYDLRSLQIDIQSSSLNKDAGAGNGAVLSQKQVWE